MKKYFYTFSLTLLLMVFSIAFLKNNVKDSFLIRNLTNFSSVFKHNFKQKYQEIFNCYSNYSTYFALNEEDSKEIDYTKPAPKETHEQRITRALLVYFPIDQISNFESEFKWLYRSWIEMQKNEPIKWRTDIVVFIKKDNTFDKKDFFLNGLNCTFKNRRNSANEKPMCSLVEYLPLKNRIISETKNTFIDIYKHLFSELDIFSDNEDNLAPFYSILKKKISHYSYLDSILMAFDGYAMLKKAGYNFLIRSDMDVFLTPLFGKWIPRKCKLI